MLVGLGHQRLDTSSASGVCEPAKHVVGEVHVVWKTAQVLRRDLQAASPSQVGQLRPRVCLGVLVVVRKNGIQRRADDAVPGHVVRDNIVACATGRPAGREATSIMQDHAAAVIKRGVFADREALGVRIVEAFRSDVADRTQPYDSSWVDRAKIDATVSGVWVRMPTALHVAHFLGGPPLSRRCSSRVDRSTRSAAATHSDAGAAGARPIETSLAVHGVRIGAEAGQGLHARF